MTDARIPERFLMDRRVVKLTDAERSSYFMATLWSVSNRTDGRFDDDDLALIPTFRRSTVPALLAAGLWAVDGGGWIDTEFKRNQTSADDLAKLENMRRSDAKKKARQRACKAGNHELCTTETCKSALATPGTVPGTSPGDSTGEDRDRDRDRDQASTGSSLAVQSSGVDEEDISSWRVVEIPGTGEDPGYCSHGMTVGMRCSACVREAKVVA